MRLASQREKRNERNKNSCFQEENTCRYPELALLFIQTPPPPPPPPMPPFITCINNIPFRIQLPFAFLSLSRIRFHGDMQSTDGLHIQSCFVFFSVSFFLIQQKEIKIKPLFLLLFSFPPLLFEYKSKQTHTQKKRKFGVFVTTQSSWRRFFCLFDTCQIQGNGAGQKTLSSPQHLFLGGEIVLVFFLFLGFSRAKCSNKSSFQRSTRFFCSSSSSPPERKEKERTKTNDSYFGFQEEE